MPIDVARLVSQATIAIGSPPASPLYEGDSLEDVTVFAEGFDTTGAINPALFATDDGGWGAEVIMDPDSDLTVTVDTPLLDDGQVILRIAISESVNKAGVHHGFVRIFNPIAGRMQQRTLFNFMIQVTELPG